jgi:hypothetical protein
LSHVFFIPCDSHGKSQLSFAKLKIITEVIEIQLCIKDIVVVPKVKAIVDKAQAIAAYFRRAVHQMAHLCTIQKDTYKRTYSFTLSVITRWGMQYKLIESILRVKEALILWASGVTFNLNVIVQYIGDPHF